MSTSSPIDFLYLFLDDKFRGNSPPFFDFPNLSFTLFWLLFIFVLYNCNKSVHFYFLEETKRLDFAGVVEVSDLFEKN